MSHLHGSMVDDMGLWMVSELAGALQDHMLDTCKKTAPWSCACRPSSLKACDLLIAYTSHVQKMQQWIRVLCDGAILHLP